MIILAQGLSREELGCLPCSDVRIRRENGRKRLLPQGRFRPKRGTEAQATCIGVCSPRPAA
jgi:hypothetical protein